MLKLRPEWKLSKKLYKQNIPEWAWLDNQRFKVWVRHYPSLNHGLVNRKLARAGYRIIGQQAGENLVALAITIDEINALASLPYLLHLQEMEDPGTPENYTARTSHRVNTFQATYPGSPHYDGSGVVVGHGDDGAIDQHVDLPDDSPSLHHLLMATMEITWPEPFLAQVI
ncbi:MAG: hypothetical protein U5L96_05725 [Owenweeksia sp.]|nr:hypothetical protein [Owenweeksia sp.]